MLLNRFKLKLSLLTVGFVFGSSLLTSYGSSLQSEQNLLAQLQQESSTTYQQISQEKAKATSLQASIHQYSVSLANIQQAINSDTKQIDALSSQLQALEQKIQANQAQLNLDKTHLNVQLQATYEDGQVAYLAVLLQSTSWDDFVTRIDTLAAIGAAQKKLLNQVSA